MNQKNHYSSEFLSINKDQGNFYQCQWKSVQDKIKQVPENPFDIKYGSVQKKQRTTVLRNGRELICSNFPFINSQKQDKQQKQEFYDTDGIKLQKVKIISFDKQLPKFQRDWKLEKHWLNYPRSLSPKQLQLKQENKQEQTEEDLEIKIKEIQWKMHKYKYEDPRMVIDEFFPFVSKKNTDERKNLKGNVNLNRQVLKNQRKLNRNKEVFDQLN